MDFLCELGRRVTQITDDHRESAFLFQRFSSTLQCGHCLVYLHLHNPRGRNIAVPAFVLVFSLLFSPRDLYYRGRLHIIIIIVKQLHSVCSVRLLRLVTPLYACIVCSCLHFSIKSALLLVCILYHSW